MTEPQIYKGLAGVTTDTTAISKVNPESNSLLYRGYPVQELAAAVGFEDVAWLLWHGELPTESEAREFRSRERASRALADNVKAAIDLLPLRPKWRKRWSCLPRFRPSSRTTSGAVAVWNRSSRVRTWTTQRTFSG